MVHNHHDHNMAGAQINRKSDCACGETCTSCQAEKLSVNCGCDSEAKQFEYRMDQKMSHGEHEHHHMENHEAMGYAAAKGHEHAGHGGHDMSKMSHMDHEAAMTDPQMAKAMEADMRRRFFISLILSIPTFLYSPVGMDYFKVNMPTPISANWIMLILTTPIVFWAGSIFITGTYYSLKARKLNMAVLIATGVLAAYLFSVLLTLTVGGETFYEAAALLVTFVLFGHWMEMKSRRGTSDSLRALFDLVPPKATVIRDGKELSIPSAEIILGDIVVAKPGDKIPVDGEVTEGESSVDEALVTGESMPILKKPADKVIGGSVNQSGLLRFKATKVGSDTVLAQIIKMVETAQNSKAPGQRLADRAAAWLVILAVGSGVATFSLWYGFGGASLLTALTFAISAVIIACPDALGLATPTAVAVGTGMGAKHNILIKDAATLENVSRLNAVVLDKTGTLTEGKPKVTVVLAFGGFAKEDILEFAASVEQGSNHPLAKAINDAATEMGVKISPIDNFESLSGFGLKAAVKGKEVLIGKKQLLIDDGVDLSEAENEIDRLAGEGKTLSLISIDRKAAGAIGIADSIKANAKAAIDELKKIGVEVAMITGDNKKAAALVGHELGIARIFAEVLPQDKSSYVKKLQGEGKFVGMVGDGINDAPALAQADIGIAIGAGTDVAIETASVVLMKSDPFDIVAAIRLSKATVRKMKQNLFWAAIYNILAIPVAAGLFYNSLGWSLRPEIAALLMSASSVVVATNAVLLKRSEKDLALK